MGTTIRHGLPLLATGQAQKDVTHNEALLAIDRQLHLAVASRGANAPPPAVAAGDSYIVGAGAGGAWTGWTDAVASFDGVGWSFAMPVRGALAWIADETRFSVYDGGWSAGGWPASGLSIGGRQVLAAEPVTVASPDGGATVDAQAREAIDALLAALRGQGILR